MSATSETKKLTIDPGVHYLAALVDELTARLDVCCPPDVAAPASESKEAAIPVPEETEKAAAAAEPRKTAATPKKAGRRPK